MMKNILVVGGENIGAQFACACAHKGYSVRLYTSKAKHFSNTLEIVGDSPQLSYSAELEFVTDDIQKAIADVDLIFVTQPAFCFKKTADMIEPFIKSGTLICIVPGNGGAEFAFKNCIDKGAFLFGLQRVPGVARMVEEGKSVRVSGLRKELYLSSIPKFTGETARFIETLFDIPCKELPNYLSVTLTPSNPILHTTRLYSMFKDYESGRTFYDRNFLFYEEWDDFSSKLLFKCDDELQKLCKSLNRLDLRQVKSLKVHYESDTPKKLTSKIQNIKSFSGLLSPMKRVEKGWIPDFSSRYFLADFPYGLAIIQEFAHLAGCNVPNIDRIMAWYGAVSGNENSFYLSSYGIETVDDIYKLYS